MFHLLTHAFFKALLFLGAGSVMHAMGGVIDIRRIGGLRRRMPTTHWTFLFGCLALAGVVPLRRLLEQGRHPGASQRPGKAARSSTRCSLGRRIVHGVLLTALLHVPAVFPHVFRPGADSRPRPAITPTSRRARMTVPLVMLAFGCAGRWGRISSGRTVSPASWRPRPRWPIWPAGRRACRWPRRRLTGASRGHQHGHHSGGHRAGGRDLSGLRARLAERLARADERLRPLPLSRGQVLLRSDLQRWSSVWPLLARRPAGRLVRPVRDRRAWWISAAGCPSCWAPAAPAAERLVQFYALAMALGLLVLLGAMLRIGSVMERVAGIVALSLCESGDFAESRGDIEWSSEE